MSNVVELGCATKLDIPVEKILDSAGKAKLTGVIVIGFDDEGAEYFASSAADGAEVLWHLQRSIHKLMKMVDEED